MVSLANKQVGGLIEMAKKKDGLKDKLKQIDREASRMRKWIDATKREQEADRRRKQFEKYYPADKGWN